MNSISKALRKARAGAPGGARESIPRPEAPVVPIFEAPVVYEKAPTVPVEPPSPTRARSDSGGVTQLPAGALPLDPRDYLYLALKHRWLILSVVFLGIAAAALYTMRQTPEYLTTAVLQLSQERVRLGNEFLERDRMEADEFFATHIRLLQSPTTAERVVRRLRLWEHPEWGTGEPPGSTPSAVVMERYASWIQSMLWASHVSQTLLIEVNASSEIPELAALVANTTVQEYISFVTERESGVAKDAATLIQDQMEKLQREIADNKAALEGQATADSQRSLSVQTLQELNRQLVEAEGQRSAAEARYETLLATEPDLMPEVMSDLAVQASQQRLDELQSQHEALLIKFKSDWPEVQLVKNSIQDLQARLTRRKRDVADRIVRQARSQADEAAKREGALRATLREQERNIQRLDSALVEFDRRKMEMESQTQIIQSLLLRESEAGFRANAEGTPPINARVVQEAKVPRYPYKPNLRLNLAMSAMASLVMAFGLVFVLERFRTSITTVEDIRRNVPAPYLGMIPRYQVKSIAANESDSLQSSYLVMPFKADLELSEAQSQVSESFKFLRTMLISVARRSSKTFIVTSPGKSSGKTFVACNLASSLAHAGKRVLLIDADLRLSRVHKIFGCSNDRGVSNILEGASIEDALVQPTAIAGLSILPAGPLPRRRSEFKQFERLETALRRITSQFDHVIVDSAPLLPVPDTIDVAKFCDEIVLTLRSRRVTRQEVEASVDLLHRAGREVTGVILNDVNLNEIATLYYQTYRHGFGGYYYRGRRDRARTGLSSRTRGNR